MKFSDNESILFLFKNASINWWFPTGKERRVRVLPPKLWSLSSRYYFHDGQNVFYSKESYVPAVPGRYPSHQAKSDISRMIIVAIDNDGLGRMNEYAAWKFQESNIGQQFGGKVSVRRVCHGVVGLYWWELSDKNQTVNTAMIGSS